MQRFSRLVILTVVAALALLYQGTAALAQPSNDDITGAVAINGLPSTVTANTSDATVAADDPMTDCFGPAATVWYSFTPSQSVPVFLHTAGSDYDTTLAVFTGSPGALTEVACNDDLEGTGAALVFNADAGTRYFIMAGTCCGAEPGQVGPGGTLVLHADVAPPPMAVSVTVNRRGTASQTGLVTVTGTITCNQSGGGNLQLRLSQRHGRLLARGGGDDAVLCGPARSTWSMQLSSETAVVFGSGQADVTWSAVACDRLTCAEASGSMAVRLRR